MMQTRTDARQVSTTTAQPTDAARSLLMRDRNRADAILRDMAYVLHLTRTVRESMSTVSAS